VVFAIVALTVKFYIGVLMAISKAISWPVLAFIVAAFCLLQGFLLLVVGVSITGYF
jgi:hydrogenase/urease accessory protein HupE